MSVAEALVADLRAALARLADPARAAATAAYLKTDQPLFGASRPDQKRIFREVLARHPLADRAEWESAVRLAWVGPERELRFGAIAVLLGSRKRLAEPRPRPLPKATSSPSRGCGASGTLRMTATSRPVPGQGARLADDGEPSSVGYAIEFLTPEAVPLLEQLVREGAWWDLVDEIATHALGRVVGQHRAELRPVLLRWIEDPDPWVRRAAILAQIRHRADTDQALLFDLCLRQAADRSFWIRKAIGWALRDYAHTDPEAVRAFLQAHGDALSGLSRREAAKHL